MIKLACCRRMSTLGAKPRNVVGISWISIAEFTSHIKYHKTHTNIEKCEAIQKMWNSKYSGFPGLKKRKTKIV